MELVIYPRPRNLLELVSEGLGGIKTAVGLGRLAQSQWALLKHMTVSMDLFRRGEPLLLMPGVLGP